VAAVIIIGITLFLLGESVQKNQPEKTVINTGPAPRIKYYTLSTAKGEKATLSLSDGSTIQLNAESKLRYPNYFDNDSREVEFEGEGYFKINPDKNRPFRVKCNNTITEVTGTEFNIRNRGEGISITVVEGSVRTFSSRSAEGVPIIKGQMVTLKNTGSFSSPVRVNLRHTTAWRENKISFAKTPLYEAADELERIYNSIDIVIISDSLKNKTISGIFDTNSLEDILSILSLTLDIKVNRDGKKIYFE
jgi:ferric-dicitrate binding protein FerR (iron transport regulator)